MIHIDDFNIDMLPENIHTIKTNKKISYLNIESAFDIETTSYEYDGNKSAFMYIWMLGIGYDGNIVYGRNWEELSQLLNSITDKYGLFKQKRLVIYVHNLSYEFQFMRKYFEWESVFASGERKPLKAVTTGGIEFRCSYMLSGYSLSKTAENLQIHNVKKLDGDLDYSLIRTHETPLTDVELGYCENDIKVVNAYINEQIQISGDITKIPLTNTGRVRKYVKDECYYTNSNHRKSNKGKYTRYRQIMNDLTLTPDNYLQLKQSFMGGFTHANPRYSGELLENVSSIDFTSSYPAVMLSEKFPMSRPKKADVKSIKELDNLCQRYGVLMEIRFENIRSSIPQENYISESKCTELKNPLINNGRVFSADILAMTITNVDYEIIKACYEWDNIEVANVNYYHLGYLPKSIIESVLNLYEDKTVLKGVEGKEIEYLLSKGMLNSIYGMSVTDIVRDDHVYSDGWDKEPADILEQVDKYNKSKNRFLYYAWGIWITAYSRANLWTGILATGHDYVYSDTDSLKMLNYQDHKKYIDMYNKMVIQKMENMCKEYKIDVARLSPKNQKGETQTIGLWDFEGTYSRFKTLGAKRYLFEENDKLYLTVAGLSKQNGLNYMLEKCNNNNTKVFEMFNDELYIPADRTGKMTHTYIDDSQDIVVKDFTGKQTRVHTKSGIHLSSCEFTLSISKQYGEFLSNFIKGYIYKGVDYI